MKNAIVTGGYGAIGTAIAEGLAAAGYSVTLVGRDPVSYTHLTLPTIYSV